MNANLKRAIEHQVCIPRELMETVAWKTLSTAGKGLFLEMRAALTADNNGAFVVSHHGNDESSYLSKYRAISQLEALGFIRRTWTVDWIEQESRHVTFAFTDIEIMKTSYNGHLERRATFAYQRFGKKVDAKRAIKFFDPISSTYQTYI